MHPEHHGWTHHDFYYHPHPEHPTSFDGHLILPTSEGFPEHRGLGSRDGRHFYHVDPMIDPMHDVHHIIEEHQVNVVWNSVTYTHLEQKNAIPSLKGMQQGF